jgi:hypothetical protein
VRVGEPGYRERRHWREERFHRDRVTVGGAGCRSVTVKERMPNGTTVIRRKSSC